MEETLLLTLQKWLWINGSKATPRNLYFRGLYFSQNDENKEADLNLEENHIIEYVEDTIDLDTWEETHSQEEGVEDVQEENPLPESIKPEEELNEYIPSHNSNDQ